MLTPWSLLRTFVALFSSFKKGSRCEGTPCMVLCGPLRWKYVPRPRLLLPYTVEERSLKKSREDYNFSDKTMFIAVIIPCNHSFVNFEMNSPATFFLIRKRCFISFDQSASTCVVHYWYGQPYRNFMDLPNEKPLFGSAVPPCDMRQDLMCLWDLRGVAHENRFTAGWGINFKPWRYCAQEPVSRTFRNFLSNINPLILYLQ